MIFCFDAYGTLFDVDGAARAAAADDPALAQVWPRLSADWRRKQLEYSWLRAITGRHADFWTVTREALDWAAEAHGAEAARDRLGALGVVVGGEVGDADPFQAVSDALAEREVDEVIISTLPTGRSRWLSADVPSRVRRAFSVPVTTVIGRVVGRS